MVYFRLAQLLGLTKTSDLRNRETPLSPDDSDHFRLISSLRDTFQLGLF